MKQKISITVDEDLLARADSLIDSVKINNRSQAIEFLLRETLSKSKISTAVILVGGSVERLRMGSGYRPMVKINGEEPFLHSIRILANYGIDEIIFIGSALLPEIQRVIEKQKLPGMKIRYMDDRNAGTAGAIKMAKKLILGDFFVIFGDIYFDFDLGKMMAFHSSHQGLVTMAVTSTQLAKSRDRLELEGDKVVDFQYVPREKSFLVSASIFLMRNNIFDFLPSGGSLETDVFPKMSKSGKLIAYNFSGIWKHIGSE